MQIDMYSNIKLVLSQIHINLLRTSNKHLYTNVHDIRLCGSTHARIISSCTTLIKIFIFNLPEHASKEVSTRMHAYSIADHAPSGLLSRNTIQENT